MTYILGLDPGLSTGWGMIHLDDDTKKINLHAFGVTKDMTMMEIKPQFERADVIVYEGWWTRPNKAQTGAFDWDPMNAPVAIGAIQTMCAILEKTAKPPQQPASKVPGYSYMGMKYHKGKKGMHAHDALAHACFFAVTKLGANPVGAGN